MWQTTIYLKVLLQNVFEIMTTSSPASLIVASHGILLSKLFSAMVIANDPRLLDPFWRSRIASYWYYWRQHWKDKDLRQLRGLSKIWPPTWSGPQRNPFPVVLMLCSNILKHELHWLRVNLFADINLYFSHNTIYFIELFKEKLYFKLSREPKTATEKGISNHILNLPQCFP